MNPSIKIWIALGAVAGLVFGAIVAVMSYVLVTGPRMRMQPNVRAYQAEVPRLPEGMVPAAAPDGAPSGKAPGVQEAKSLTNPLSAGEENVARGKVYYQYYCVFCHGELGDGNGPVGDSYVPKPADVRNPKIQAYSDGEMLRAMLTGTGHEPVLERVVPPEHRWPLVLYLRSLNSPAAKRP